MAPAASESASWYEQLRERYRPELLRVLLVAESPPDPGSGQRRFFYSPTLTIDNLYRGVAEAVYGQQEGINLRDKPAILERLCCDGFWLTDATDRPVKKMKAAERKATIASSVPRLIERCIELSPERGVLICHAKVFSAVAPALRDAGIHVLHDRAIPFPLGNWRAKFVAGFRDAIEPGRDRPEDRS